MKSKTFDRRTFLKTGTALVVGAAAGCATAPQGSGALRGGSDALLRSAVSSGEVPGVVAAVTTPGGPIYESAFGVRVQGGGVPMTMDTVMWIASMTKPMVGAAAMQLVEQGRIGLDEPAAKIIPSLGQVQVLTGWDSAGKPLTRPPASQMTLRHLLTHTSGYVYDIWDPELARYHKTMDIPRAGSGRNLALSIPLAYDPGRKWEYGIGIDWAGKMVEAVSGMRLGEYMKRNLFDPLGMGDTAFRITPEMRARMAKVHARQPDGSLTVTPFEVPQSPEFEPGGGGIYSTAIDYQKFMRMIMNGGRGNGNQVLRPETVALMSKNAMGNVRVEMLKTQNPVLSHDAEFFTGTAKTWGLSFMINEETAPTGRSPGSLAWAGLANTYFWIDPRRNLGGVIMMQVLPFVDPKSLALFYAFEKGIYDSIS